MKKVIYSIVYGLLTIFYYVTLPFAYTYDWIKRHWKGAVATVASIALGVFFFLVVRNVPQRQQLVEKTMFAVNRFIRNLPEGQTHSLEKAKEAAQLGIILKPNQTIVDPHFRTR